MLKYYSLYAYIVGSFGKPTFATGNLYRNNITSLYIYMYLYDYGGMSHRNDYSCR